MNRFFKSIPAVVFTYTVFLLLAVACTKPDQVVVVDSAPSAHAQAASEGVERPALSTDTAPKGDTDGHSNVAAAGGDVRPLGNLTDPFDYYFGVYLNGSKIGWMHTELKVEGEVHKLSVLLQGAIRGLGKVSKIKLEEERTYGLSDGKLRTVLFAQTASTGTTRSTGKVVNGTLHLKVESGTASSDLTFVVNDTLESELATRALARSGRVGARGTTQHFDAGIMKTLNIEHKVLSAESRMFAGVQTEAVHIESTYKELGIVERSWYDRSGKMLEAKIGGFFVARLEPPGVAKKLDYSQDLLVSAVIKSPRSIDNAEQRDTLSITFTGFTNGPPPSSDRQQVKEEKDHIVLTLSKDRAPEVPYPLKRARKPTKDLEATPFIQSKHKDIIDTARRVIGDATDLYTATSRLSSYVYSHIRDEYVPAYSNALEALTTARGDCTEHSVLFVALARAAGIPARVAVGVAYWEAGGGFGWHAWAEVRDTNGDWYSVDPTWDQPIADVTHIKLAGGGPAQQARIVMLLGSLKITDLQL